jgi:hypothetical protein
MNYSVSKYGRGYAIFCKESRCYVLFYKTKKAATLKANELNK